MHNVHISLGSNLGDKEANLKSGIASLDASDGVRVIDVSRFYQTEPVDYTDQDWFVNAVARIETTLEPDDLLTLLKSIERNMGRDLDAMRYGPRVLDLDILLYGDRIHQSERVTVPHERMHCRAFVLVPLCDIAADAIHPVMKKSIKTLLAELDDDHQGVMQL